MNKSAFLSELILLFRLVLFTDECIDEIIHLLEKSGQEERFLKLFQTRVKLLLEYGKSAITISPTNYEKLKYIDRDLYSMRIIIPGKNIRILYGFFDDTPVLLLAFHERSDSDTYSMHENEAISRFDKLKEEQL